MSDLTEQQSSLAVKITGADATGVETNYVHASASGDMYSSDCINTAATSGTISLTTSPSEIKVGASRVSSRKWVIAQAKSNNIVWGFSSGDQSFPLPNGQMLSLRIGDVPIYVRVTSATGSLAVAEAS